MQNFMEIVEVSKFYKKFKAVDDVSLTINKGEFLTILGPSGSGKTSLLKLIAGFEQISAGRILLDGTNISRKKVFERNIGMLFQNYALFPHLTVFENIAYPLKLRRFPNSEIEKLVKQSLDLVKLKDLGSRYPAQLSGGQQQRVALARAIVFKPTLLLLDEPLSALDKNLREHMQMEIKRIQENAGITTISVTHDQKEALTMSDRICVMNEGKIEQVDTPHNIYKYPKNRFVAEFIGEINIIDGNIVGNNFGSIQFKTKNNHLLKVKQNSIDKTKSLFVAIRPENIQIIQESGTVQNCFTATPKEIIYLGEGIKVLMETDEGFELNVKVSSLESHLIRIGEKLQVGWNETEASFIEDTSIAEVKEKVLS